MMSTRTSIPARGLTWLLAVVFSLASTPAPLFAQDPLPTPADAARARIQQLREARAAAAAEKAAPEAPAEVQADAGASSDSPSEDGDMGFTPKFQDAPIDQFLDEYSKLTGRTMIKAPGVAGTFNFKAREKLTKAEMIQAMDSLLSMNNLALVPLGERFFRVVQIDKAPTEGLAIQRDGLPAGPDIDADDLRTGRIVLMDMARRA